MTHQPNICQTRGAHVWETLDDGAEICFECNARKQPDICQNRHGGNAESEAAFQDLLPTLTRQRHVVFKLIHASGGDGLTAHEAAAALGKTPNAVSGRFTELKAAGLITKSGRRPTPTGSSAGVYRVAMAGVMLVDDYLTKHCGIDL